MQNDFDLSMKLTTLNLMAVGPFTSVVLDLLGR